MAVGNPAITAGSVTVASATQITATLTIAANAATGAANVTVTTTSGTSNGAGFTVLPALSITSLSSPSGPVGYGLTIQGSGFGSSQGTSTVTFNHVSAGTATSRSDTSITVDVPGGATTGNVVVTVGGVASNGSVFTVTLPPDPRESADAVATGAVEAPEEVPDTNGPQAAS